jgi:hypothetical protein
MNSPSPSAALSAATKQLPSSRPLAPSGARSSSLGDLPGTAQPFASTTRAAKQVRPPGSTVACEGLNEIRLGAPGLHAGSGAAPTGGVSAVAAGFVAAPTTR